MGLWAPAREAGEGSRERGERADSDEQTQIQSVISSDTDSPAGAELMSRGRGADYAPRRARAPPRPPSLEGSITVSPEGAAVLLVMGAAGRDAAT